MTGVQTCALPISVAITDNNGCLDFANIILTDPSPMTSSIAVMDVSCLGLCDGIATANANNGTAPYTYAWDDPNLQATKTAGGLCAGSYNVTITDVNGCFTTSQTIVRSEEHTSELQSRRNLVCRLLLEKKKKKKKLIQSTSIVNNN